MSILDDREFLANVAEFDRAALQLSRWACMSADVEVRQIGLRADIARQAITTRIQELAAATVETHHAQTSRERKAVG